MKKTQSNLTISGRSLLELLAVIMIMGVIGIMIVIWLNQALDRNAAKQTYKDIAMRASSLATYAPLTQIPASDVAGTWPRGYTRESEGLTYDYYKISKKIFAVRINALSAPVCRYLREMSFKNSSLLGTTETLPYASDGIDFDIKLIQEPTEDGRPQLACAVPTSSPLFYFNIDTMGGSHGGSGTPGGGGCACPANEYADEDGNCIPCPCGSTSEACSTGIGSCTPTAESGVSTLAPLTCMMGYEPDSEGVCCSICPQNTYSPDGTMCMPCPCGATTSSTGMTSITDCQHPFTKDFTTSPYTCIEGAKINGECCELSFCPCETIHCDPKSGPECNKGCRLKTGYKSLIPEVTCDKGYHKEGLCCTPDNPATPKCPCGLDVCPNDGVTPCQNGCALPKDRGIEQIDPFVTCKDNYDNVSDEDPVTCCQLKENPICPCGTEPNCEGEAFCDHGCRFKAGYKSLFPVECAAGYEEYDDAGETCCTCPENTYQKGVSCVPCPCGSHSPRGSTSIEACRPLPEGTISWGVCDTENGYELNERTGCCQTTPKNCTKIDEYYDPTDGTCKKCPCGSTTRPVDQVIRQPQQASSGNDDEYIGSNIGIDSCSLPDGTASWNPLTCNTDEGYFPIKRSNGETCCTKKSSICGCTYVDEDGDGKEDLRCEPYAKEGETPIKYEACAKALLQISKGKKDKSFPIDFACCCGEATKDPNICYTKEKYKSLDWVNGAKLETGEFCVMHYTTNDKDKKVTYSCKDLNKTSDEGVCSTEKDNALANKNGQFICSLSRMSWYEALKYCETVATKEGIIGGQSLFEARNIASILHGGKVGARCSTPLCRGLAITSKMRKLRKACNIQGTGTRLPAFVWSATEDGECQAQAVSLNGMQWPSQLIPKSMPKAAQNSQQGSFYALCRGYCPKNFKSSSDECYCEAGKKIVPSGNDCKECAKKHYSFEDSDGCFACRGVEVVLNEASRKFQVNIENDKEGEPYISVPLSKLEEERSLMLGKNVNGDVAVCLCSHKEDGKTVYFSPEYDGTCGCGAGNYKDKSKTTENTCNRCSANSKKKERGLWDSSGMGGLSSCQKCKDLTAVQPTVSDKYCSCLSEEGIYSEDADTPVMDLSCSNKCGEQCKDCGEDTDCMNDCDYCKAACNLSSINDPASTADGRTKAYVEYWKSRTRTRTESCVCDAGYYLNHGKCKPCEEGKISAIGSTKPSHCINPKTICEQDWYLDVDKKHPENSVCKKCPNNVRGMTQCSAAGSIGRDACSHRECLRRDRSGCNIFQKMINECTFCEYKCSNNSRTQCEDCTCPGNAKAEIYCDFYGDQKDVGARRLAVCTNTDVDTAGDDLRSYVIWDRAACEDAKRAADPTSEEMPDACLYVDLPGKMSNHISSGATHFLRYNRETDRTQYKCPFVNAGGHEMVYKAELKKNGEIKKWFWTKKTNKTKGK